MFLTWTTFLAADLVPNIWTQLRDSQSQLSQEKEIKRKMSGASEEIIADSTLDIRAETCPMTFVRTRLALDRLAPGQVLALWLKGEEPRLNVPKTAEEQGHAILRLEELPDGVTRLWLRKSPLP